MELAAQGIAEGIELGVRLHRQFHLPGTFGEKDFALDMRHFAQAITKDNRLTASVFLAQKQIVVRMIFHIDRKASFVARPGLLQADSRRSLHREMLLAEGDESRRCSVAVERSPGCAEAETAIAGEKIICTIGILEVNPFRRKCFGLEIRVFRTTGKRMLEQRGDIHFQRDRSVAVHHRPGIRIPTHRRQEGFAPQRMMRFPRNRPESEANQPPRAVRRLD